VNAAPQLHDRVGPYQLVKAIGAGGSARVDLARVDRAYGFQRHVVIKRPLEHLRGEARAGESLRREARLGGQLRHPNLVSILDAGVHDNYDFIVLEYVHGGALRTMMQADDPALVRDVSLEVALTIVRDVARGLHHAHELTDDNGASLGLVHRDVSPGNVLIGLDGAVKLADFGIAKETRVTTLSGSMHGTVTYMAPEQCRGHAFDRRADVFSLGVILYELATGHRLFWADNDVASLHRVLEGNVPRARKLKASIPAALDEIIMSAVASDPGRRTATARKLADEIEAFANANGHMLVNRNIARWVHEVMGPRDAPWIGAQTVIDVAPIVDVPSEPLVDVIAAAPADEVPPETFGPTDASFDDIDTQPDRKRNRKPLAVIAAVVLVAGAAVALWPRGETIDAPASQPIIEAPVPIEIKSKEVVIEPPPPAPVVEAPAPKRKRVKPAPTPPVVETAPVVKPKVQWDPTMLLPTDTGSGTKRK
jgi:eukaryotic-like serine/threonine-protein kinase